MRAETRSFYEVAVQRAVESVVRDLDRALDLQALAHLAALSPFHFHRIFRSAVGETPLELHRRLRMERAAFELVNGDAPITEIAFSAGYETHESFTRAFRALYQRSPSEFRQSREVPRAAGERPFQIEIAARSGIHFPVPDTLRVHIQFDKGDRSMNVDVKRMPELRVATLRHIGPYNRISEAFSRLGDLAARGGSLDAAPTLLAIYYDDPESTPAAELRSDAAVVIPDAARVPSGLAEQRLPAGRYASTTHVGPYEQLGDVWARFMGQWLPESGERAASNAVSYEIYRNTPASVPKAQLETELYIQLA